MKALVFERTGEPREVLQFREIERPVVRRGQVLVNVEARPVHPADRAFVRGQYRLRPEFPQVAGLEGVGTIIKSGAETGWEIGTKVAFRAPGSWAERVAVPVERLIEVPEGIAAFSACQVSLNPLTAFGLLQEAAVDIGDSIIFTAATSTVSNILGAIARERGIRTIGLVRGDAQHSIHRCVADAVLSVDDPDVVTKILDAAGDTRPAAVLDSVGGSVVSRLFPTLRPGGTVVAYGVQSNEAAMITNATLIYANLTWKGFGIDRWISQNRVEVARIIKAVLWPMIRSGALQLEVAGAHALQDFGQALREEELPGRRGKMLLI